MKGLLLLLLVVSVCACREGMQREYAYDGYGRGVCDSLMDRRTELAPRERVLVTGQWLEEHCPPPLGLPVYRGMLDTCLVYAAEAAEAAPEDMRTEAGINLFAVYVARLQQTDYREDDREALLPLMARLEDAPKTAEQACWYHYYVCRYYRSIGAWPEFLKLAEGTLGECRACGNTEAERLLLRLLASFYRGGGDYAKAMACCDTLLAAGDGLPAEVRRQLWLERAYDAQKAGLCGEAVRSYRMLGSDTLKTNYFAVLYAACGQYAAALRFLRDYRGTKAVTDGEDIRLLQLEADFRDGLGQASRADSLRAVSVARAEAAAAEVRRRRLGLTGISPGTLVAYSKRAAALYGRGRLAEAAGLLAPAAAYIRQSAADSGSDAAGTYVDILRQYTAYCRAAGRYREALDAWQAADSLQQACNAAQRLPEEYTQLLARHEVTMLRMETDRYRTSLAVARAYRLFWAVAAVLLALSTLLFALLYRHRRRTLRELYRRQRENEAAQALFRRQMAAAQEKTVTPEEKAYRELEKRVHDGMLFADPQFTLEQLAKLVGKNRTYISSVINNCAGMNFNQWINGMRVRYVIGHIGEDKAGVLGELAGFPSRSSYFRIFKELTGLTPAQYLRERKKECKNA